MTVRLMLGDCLERMQEIEAGSVDMVLCDLPYGTTRNKWDAVIPFAPLWAEYDRVCRGPVVLFAQSPFDKVLGASNLQALRYEWIWEKTAATGHLNATRAPLKAHEAILVFYDRQPTYNPQMETGKPYSVKRKGTGTNYGAQRETQAVNDGVRCPRSVLRFAKDKQSEGFHPTQKPVALLEYLIRTYTHEGETVLDNTMGSGSTGVACLNTRRQFIGIERDPGYFATAQSRLAAVRQEELAI